MPPAAHVVRLRCSRTRVAKRLGLILTIWGTGTVAFGEALLLTPDMAAISLFPGTRHLNISRDALPDADVTDVGLSLSPSRPHYWLGQAGTPFPLNMTLAPSPAPDRVIFTIWNWNRQPVLQREWTPPHAETLSIQSAGRGTYILTLDRLRGDAVAGRLVRSFSICPSNRGKQAAWLTENGFFLGTCAYPDRLHWRNKWGSRYPSDMSIDQARELEALLAGHCGLQVVRLTNPGDAAVRLYQQHGLRPFVKLTQAEALGSRLLPKYEHHTDGRWRYPMPMELCQPHIAGLGRRLSRQALFFEIGNEADNRDFWRGTTEEFIALVRLARTELSREAPGIPVCAAGWTFIEPERTKACMAAFGPLLPWSSIHAHGTFRRCVEQLGKFETLLTAVGAGEKPRVQTEMGFCHWRLDMDTVAAAHAARKILYHWAAGYEGVITYRLRDQGGPRLAGEAGGMWGMLDQAFCPRFKYGVLAALIHHFAGFRYERALATGPDCYAYVFSRGPDHLVAAFAADIAWSRSPMGSLTTDATDARRIDAMGNETPLADADHIVLNRGIHPVYVRLHGATRLSFKTAAASPANLSPPQPRPAPL